MATRPPTVRYVMLGIAIALPGCRPKPAPPTPDAAPAPDSSGASVEWLPDPCSVATNDEVGEVLGTPVRHSSVSELHECLYDFGRGSHDVSIASFVFRDEAGARSSLATLCRVTGTTLVAGAGDEACSTTAGGSVRKGRTVASVGLLNKAPSGERGMQELLRAIGRKLP